MLVVLAATAESTGIYQSLFRLYMAVAIVIGLLVVSWLFYNMVRFRASRGGPTTTDAPRLGRSPSERGRGLWVYGMAVGIAGILFALAFGTIGAVEHFEEPPAEDRLYVNVTAIQFGWIFNTSGRFQTVNDAHVPVGKVVVLNVTSRDVFHNFAVPDYKIRIDAIPGQTNHLWFRATEAGVAQVVCVELCGLGHAHMKGTITAIPPDDYQAWVDEKTKPKEATP